jgi:hypothetical protein
MAMVRETGLACAGVASGSGVGVAAGAGGFAGDGAAVAVACAETSVGAGACGEAITGMEVEAGACTAAGEHAASEKIVTTTKIVFIKLFFVIMIHLLFSL